MLVLVSNSGFSIVIGLSLPSTISHIILSTQNMLCYFLPSIWGFYRYSTKKNGRQMYLGGDQSKFKLFTYVHGVPGGENMGGNIPTYFLVKSKYNIYRQTSSREERASNWVNNTYSPSHNYFGNRFIRVSHLKERHSRPSANTSTFTNIFC